MTNHSSIVGLRVKEQDSFGEGEGFIVLRRTKLQNLRQDETASQEYTCDFIERPRGLDAVVVVLFSRAIDGAVKVLLRDGLRPALSLVRPDETRLFSTEVVAGVIEEGEATDAGLRYRAIQEVHEEAGYKVLDEHLFALGERSYPSPGVFPEALYFFAAEVTAQEGLELPGDGSPMEEGASTHWVSLDEAISQCTSGTIADMKTEVALRRLFEYLQKSISD